MASGSKNTVLDTPERETAAAQAAREAAEEIQRREALIARNADLYESFLKSLEQKEELGKGEDHSLQKEKGPLIDLTQGQYHRDSDEFETQKTSTGNTLGAHPSSDMIAELKESLLAEIRSSMPGAQFGTMGERNDYDRQFTPEIVHSQYPQWWRGAPSMEPYDGEKDPEDHFSHVDSVLNVVGLSDQCKCKVFPSTFRDDARRWFRNLPPSSIKSWKDFRCQFIHAFIGSRRLGQPAHYMMSIRQEPNETLQEYVSRFTKESRKVNNKEDSTMLTAFVNGVKPGFFNRSLIERYPRSYGEALERAQLTMVGEEADRSKQAYYAQSRNQKRVDKAPAQSWTPAQKPVNFKRGGMDRRRDFPPRHPIVPDTELTPLTASRSHILFATMGKNVLQKPSPLISPEWKKNIKKHCKHHNDYGHTTEECVDLIQEVERAVRRGDLREFVARKPHEVPNRIPPRNPGPPRNQTRTTSPAHQTTRGDINVISGGPTHGDSNSARKAQARTLAVQTEKGKVVKTGAADIPISFSNEDYHLDQGTDDPLVIEMIIAEFRVRRILVDSGSSVNILFESAFQMMGIDHSRIEKVNTPLVGFGNNSVRPVGRIALLTTIRDGDRARTELLEYIVIQGPSAYNAFLGRPGLNRFGAVSSCPHMMLKFKTSRGIASIKGNVISARQCYMATLDIASKSNASTNEKQ